MTQVPYIRSQTGRIVIVAIDHHLYLFVDAQWYIFNNPSNPHKSAQIQTVDYDPSDTPEMLSNRLGIPVIEPRITRLSALFNEILSTYIATEELREQYRQKWQQHL